MKWGACVLLWMIACSAHAETARTVAVIGEDSLHLQLTRSLRQYTATQQVVVSAAYESTAQLEHSVVEGAGYDVVITATPSIISNLKQQGIVDATSEAVIARGELVLITSASNTAPMTLEGKFPAARLIETLDWQPGLMLGNPALLYQGTLARQALKHYGVDADLEPYIVYENKLEDMLDTVADQGSYAIVYQHDVAADSRFRIIGTLALSSHAPIEYRALVLAGENMEEARRLIDYFKQAKSQALLQPDMISKSIKQ